MLAIRMQRTGRSGHAQFRVIVQDARRSPTSGNVVALLGHYNPHTKAVTLEKEKASFYLEHGAQPSDRVARLLKSEGVKLPKWVALEGKKKGSIRNPDKLRKNRPEGVEAPPTKAEKEEAKAEEAAEAEAVAAEQETSTEVAAEPAEEPTAEETPVEGAVPESTVAEEPATETTTPEAEAVEADETAEKVDEDAPKA